MEPLMASQDHGDDDMRGEEKIREDNISKEDKPRYRFDNMPPSLFHKYRAPTKNLFYLRVGLYRALLDGAECFNGVLASRCRKEFKTEYKKKFRPFSQYEYVEGRFMKRRGEDAPSAPSEQPEPQQPAQPQQPWYTEVIELRKKAGEYKVRVWRVRPQTARLAFSFTFNASFPLQHRGWGTELAPEHISELYSKQILLWEQVSKRSSLSALSLAAVAASPRSISKEEKEKKPIHD